MRPHILAHALTLHRRLIVHGQRLAAFVVPEEGTAPSAEELRQAVKAELAGFKVPRDITFVDSVPRNQTGKVDRLKLVPRS
ncbi:AMP-binding enzyme [Nonomuraea sp. 3N208]|uniref:AMP-binding enzyme n=1 Tax=Nonomuraea sp. 3N208 TaxID=3457421 RepID=UPI003FCFF53F